MDPGPLLNDPTGANDSPPSPDPSSDTASASRGINLNPLNLNLNPLNLNLNPLNLNLNPLNLNLNPLNLHMTDLNPLNIDLTVHRERVNHLFNNLHSGTHEFNNKMQDVITKIRSNEYKAQMHQVLTKIKHTKEYQSSSTTDYDVVFESVDMYTNLQTDAMYEKEVLDGSYSKRFHNWMKKERISTLLFVPVLGILVAVMGLACDLSLIMIEKGRTFLVNLTGFTLINAMLYVAYSVFLAFISASCVSFISPYAVGSGIPEIKSILSGIDLSRVLGRRTLISKLVGMVCAVGAGLTVGRTGPFMHASAIIAHQMMQFRIFSNIRKNQIARYQMIIGGLAAGVVANFGAPIGGLLFSIEVTGTNCLFGNLWKGFLCAATCALFFYVTRGLTGGVAFGAVYKFDFVSAHYGALELCSFVALGVFCGLLGAFFVYTYEKLVRFRLRYQFLRQSRIGLVVVVATLSAIITYASGPFGRLPLSKAMIKLIGKDDPSPNLFDNKFENLLVFIAVKFVLTIFNVILPIPGGAITPFLVLGAALGRLFGEAMNLDFTTGVIPAGYAVIGAAGLVSGTIRALSPAVFILELTGQLSLLIPVLICSITASAVGNFFTRPLFDIALKIQNLPFLSNFRSERVYRMTAKDVMRTDIKCLSMTSTVQQVIDFLAKHDYLFIPLVQSEQTMILEGIAERSSLKYVVDSYIEQRKARSSKPPAESDAILVVSSEESVDQGGDHGRDTVSLVGDGAGSPDNGGTYASPPDGKDWDSWQDIILADVMNESDSAVLMDFSPSQIPESTPLNKIFHLFIMLGLSFTFVTRYGSLVGVIVKKDLIKQEL